jgi:hypothetical protein
MLFSFDLAIRLTQGSTWLVATHLIYCVTCCVGVWPGHLIYLVARDLSGSLSVVLVARFLFLFRCITGIDQLQAPSTLLSHTAGATTSLVLRFTPTYQL